MKKHGKLQLKSRIAGFFKETFRRRTREDYREFFTRGLSDEPRERVYPFVYARLFILFFAVFAALSLFIWLSANRISLPAAIFFGGVLVNVPLCTLLYELNPDADFSYAGLIITMLVGGVVSSLLTTFGYFLYRPENEWASAAYTGVLEELAKGAALIFAYILWKKRAPYMGFLLGAAVGAGFSIVEDMGYIVFYGGGMHSLSGLVGMSVVRGICSFGAHIFWSGLVGYAFARFGFRLKFWLFAFLSVLLHFLWDVPIDFWWAFLVEFCCFLVVAIASFLIILSVHDDKRETAIQLKIPVFAPPDKGKTYAARCNVITFCAAVALSCLALVCVVLPRQFKTDDLYFETYEELLNYVQCGKNYSADLQRAYDENGENYSLNIYRGRIVTADQREIFDGYSCEYRYFFVYDTESDKLDHVDLAEVVICIDGGETFLPVEEIIVEEEACLPYVKVRKEVSSCFYDVESGRFVAATNYRVDHSRTLIIGGVAAVLIAFYTAGFVVNYKKSRRTENG